MIHIVKVCFQCIWYEDGYPCLCGSIPSSDLGCEHFRRYNGERVPDKDLI